MSKYPEGTIMADTPAAKFNVVFVDRRVGKRLDNPTQNDEPVVYIEDLCNTYGSMSVTNDAERVVKWVNNRHPGYRIMYKDTDGNWGQLVHKDGKFLGFRPGHAPAGYDPSQSSPTWEGEVK